VREVEAWVVDGGDAVAARADDGRDLETDRVE